MDIRTWLQDTNNHLHREHRFSDILSPGATNRSIDSSIVVPNRLPGRSSDTRPLRRVQRDKPHKRQRSQSTGSRSSKPNLSSLSKLSSNSTRYTRRPRRRTKADKYEPKQQKRHDRQRPGKQSRTRRIKRRAAAGKTQELLRSPTNKHVDNETRLTVRCAERTVSLLIDLA